MAGERDAEIAALADQIGRDVKQLLTLIPESSTQGRALLKAATPATARGLINAATPPLLLPAGTTAVPIDTPVGLVLWRA